MWQRNRQKKCFEEIIKILTGPILTKVYMENIEKCIKLDLKDSKTQFRTKFDAKNISLLKKV